MFEKLKRQLYTTYAMGLLQAKSYRVLNAETARILSEFSISPVDWALLGLLYEKPEGIPSTELASLLLVEAPFVTELRKDLMAKGLVKTEKGKADRRILSLLLTAKGQALVPKVEKLLRDRIRFLFEGLSLRELVAYRNVLARIAENGEEGSEKKKAK